VTVEVTGGQTLGVFGPNGAGKTTLLRVLATLLRPHAGSARVLDAKLPDEAWRVRGQVGYVGHEPLMYRDLSARDNLRFHARLHRVALERVDEVLEAVGLDPDVVNERRPHQFSGGQCQRICIARSLVLEPKVIIADEPVSNLDASVRGEILALLMRLRAELRLSILIVTHDLGLAWTVADRVAVMYLGRIVELAATEDIFAAPNHPYTQALLDEVPRLEARKKKFSALKGEIPSPLHPPPGSVSSPASTRAR
jgi:peptide/nickel transport system ATP-binding protein